MVGAQFVIASECMTVTSAMRKSPRWANAGIAAILGAGTDSDNGGVLPSAEPEPTGIPQAVVDASESLESSSSTENFEENYTENRAETSLVLGFAAARTALMSDTPGATTVKPFFAVVRSPLVSGHVTSLALSSLEKFLAIGLIGPEVKDIESVLPELVHALTYCRFEATDRQEDDAVLLQLMSLLEKVVGGPCGALLPPATVADVVDTCLSMVRQMKRRDALRRSVEAALMALVHVVARNAPANNPESEVENAFSTLLNKLVAALDSNVRTTALHGIQLAFELFPSLPTYEKSVGLIWKHLAQLVRATSNARLLHSVLQTVLTIMNCCPEKYKQQFEFILVYLLTSLTPLTDLPRDESTDDMFYAGVPNRAKSVKSAPIEPGSNILAIPSAATSKTPEIREVMVEALATMAGASMSFFPDLFATYDCDRGSPDLCEDLVGFLCRNAYPDSASWSSASVPPLCLEAVLSGVTNWVEQTNEPVPTTDETRKLLNQKEGKAVEGDVADLFNKSPNKGIDEMVKHGLVASNKPEDVAPFLHSCTRLNKAVLGKFFAKSENKDVLAQYVKTLDFGQGQRIDQALRTLCSCFRLPGESAQIENLLQKFADHYFAAGDKVEGSSDQAFILSYAVLMLNTDHYSPTLKRRMDFEAFRKNVQGVDKNLPTEYVEAIFDGITSQEIIMIEEHDTDETFEQSWNSTIQGERGKYLTTGSQFEVVKAVFETTWRPIVSTLSFVFATASDDLVFRRVITGFHELALLAARFGSQQALNHIVACLSHISVLTSGDLAFVNANIEIRIEEHARVIVSDLSTQFGSDLKAQMASITLFRILQVAASEIGPNAYGLVARALTNLHLYGLGTVLLNDSIKPLPPFHSFERSKAGKPVGIFSALSSYLTSSADAPSEPSDENVDAALSAADCIKACKIDETVHTLLERSPKSFAEGVLSVLPRQIDAKYQPAKEYLLKIAGHVARSQPELKQRVCREAANAGLTATALSVAPDAAAAEAILNELSSVDEEILEVILSTAPSATLWRLIGLVEKPDERVWQYIATNANDTTDNLDPVLTALQKTDVDRNGRAVKAFESLADKLRAQDTDQYLAIVGSLAALCGSQDAETRERALSAVQREFLHDKQRIGWEVAANKVFIPQVLEVLVQPAVWKKDPSGMDLTRQQGAAMLGKVFLHLTESKSESDADVDAWVACLKLLDRLLSSRRQPALQESIEEMLKNVILVTKLASKGTPKFWECTERELKGFLPEIAALTRDRASEETNKRNEHKDEPKDKTK